MYIIPEFNNHANSNLKIETYNGRIKSLKDALLVLEGARLGYLPKIKRRLNGLEREFIKPNCIFAWNETECGMKRWTDGKIWSASKVSGPFLIYKELDNDKVTLKKNGFTKQSFSLTTKQQEKLHLIAYYREDLDSNDLMTPTSDPMLKDIRLNGNIYQEYLLYYDHHDDESVMGYPYYPFYGPMVSLQPMMSMVNPMTQGSMQSSMGTNMHQPSMPVMTHPMQSPSMPLLSGQSMPPQLIQQNQPVQQPQQTQPQQTQPQQTQPSVNQTQPSPHSIHNPIAPINLSPNSTFHPALHQQIPNSTPQQQPLQRLTQHPISQSVQNRQSQTVYPMPINNYYQYPMYPNYYMPNKPNETPRPMEETPKMLDLQTTKTFNRDFK